MRRIVLDWQEIESLSLDDIRILALTDVSALIFLACSNLYNAREHWQYGDDDVTDEQWDDISKAIGQAEGEIMSALIGVILPHVRGTISAFKMLPCDGATYLRTDYPLLYDALENTYQIDADTFFVPDLRGRFPLGQSTDYLVADMGGTSVETLTAAQMPAHTHDNAPHAHSEIIPVSTIINGGLEAPATASIPSPSTTGLTSISINPAGGDEEHNNMPPYYVVFYAIVAG